MNDNSKKENKKTNDGKLGVGAKIGIVATVIVIIIVLGLIAYVTNTIIKKQNYTPENPVATIEVENFGTIKVELYPEYAPNTVANFIALANRGFYDGLTFHRTIPDFMIQGGDVKGDGTGSATLTDLGIEEDETDEANATEETNAVEEETTEDSKSEGKAYNIKGEFILNGFTQNTLKHKKGVISMARSDYSGQGSTTITKKGYDSASSQFFIMTEDNASLDGSYAAFGMVIEGMDVVEKIANVEVETRDENEKDENKTLDRPVNPPVIKSITIDTKGVDYGMPETVEPFDYYSYMMQQYYGSGNSGNSGLTEVN